MDGPEAGVVDGGVATVALLGTPDPGALLGTDASTAAERGPGPSVPTGLRHRSCGDRSRAAHPKALVSVVMSTSISRGPAVGERSAAASSSAPVSRCAAIP